jgi:uncharacterized protein (TIGR00255 family)
MKPLSIITSALSTVFESNLFQHKGYPMESMTGYGSHTLEIRNTIISAQARSVNQKGLQLVFRFPPILAGIEGSARERAQTMFRRGRIEVSVSVSSAKTGNGHLSLDMDLARSYVDALDSLSHELDIPGEMSGDVLIGLPGVMTYLSQQDIDPAIIEETGIDCVFASLDALRDSRRAEGKELSGIFRSKLQQISRAAEPLMDGQESRVLARLERFRERVDSILRDTSIDEHRLLSELALMADRVDISEEFERLNSHVAASLVLLEEDERESGRKLGFLFQEMLREVNTMGAKVADSDASLRIIGIKDILGSLREQVANIE